MYYNTKTENIGGINYCIYCGEKAKQDFEFDHYDRCDYNFCDCDGANAEREKEEELERLNSKYAKRMIAAKDKLNDLNYEWELKKLKNKQLVL